jgi:hypothetical protein
MHRALATARGLALAGLLLAPLASLPLAAQEFYWETPRPLSAEAGRFPALIQLRDGLVAVWQESEGGGMKGNSAGEGQIWLALSRYRNGAWEAARRFAGPYTFRGVEPSVFTAVGEGSRIAVAAATGEGQVEVLVSQDGGANFKSLDQPAQSTSAVAPRIFLSSTGGYVLFVSQGEVLTAGADAELTLSYSSSPDGQTWQPFATLERNLKQDSLPVMARLAARGRDIVVFQSRYSPDPTDASKESFQLYSKTSTDGGITWSAAKRLTDFPEPAGDARGGPDSFVNERPMLATAAGKLWLAWERRPSGGVAAIYATSLDPTGAVNRADLARVSGGTGSCGDPQIAELSGQVGITWFDNRRGGNHVYLARLSKGTWTESELSRGLAESVFGAAAAAGGRPYAVWQSRVNDQDRIYVLEPDTTAPPPTLLAADFTPGKRSGRKVATMRVELPQDPSGIQGYSWIWTRDPKAEPPHRLMALPEQKSQSATADQDGAWYFAAAVVDYAGNWSTAARLRFDLDTTPPTSPILIPAEVDDKGFLLSNSFSLRWLLPENRDGSPVTDVAGYTWVLRYIGGLEEAGKPASLPKTGRAPRPPLPGLSAWESALVEAAGPPLPPPAILGTKAEVSYRNVDNGYYLFSVAAIDDTGNIGSSSSILLRADKYVPYTSVVLATASRDDLGRTTIRILGRGFTANGYISRIVLDRDGAEPWDLDRNARDGGFQVLSDREIDGLRFDDLPAGAYRIGLYHPTRGWYWTGPVLTIDVSGTVKYGDQSPPYKPSWTFASGRSHPFSIYDAIVLLAVLFSALGILLLARQAVAAARDAETIRLEVQALVSGGSMPTAIKAEQARRLQRRGAGLRTKVTLTIAGLVLFVVFLVAIPLGFYMTRTESDSLANGLRQRAQVLLDSVAQGGTTYLKSTDTYALELGLLTQQAKAMDDAVYLTVTGYGRDSKSTDPEIVWAQNDPDILSKIDTKAYEQGISRISDSLSPLIPTIVAGINEKALADIGVIDTELVNLNREASALSREIADPNTPRAKADQDRERLAQIGAMSRDYGNAIAEKLLAIGNASSGSIPAFDPAVAASTSRHYLFYKPIIYRQGQDKVYFRGMVRLEVTTDRITATVRAAITNLIRITLLIGALALALGIIGAFVLSTVIVVPIRVLVDAIETIRDEPDKEQLENLAIDVNTHDEIHVLAETVKQMTDGLVGAAKASKELIVGKGIQKMFIPLDPAPGSKAKLSTGRHDEKAFEVFGYYEGAKGVSGDYWDFKSINSRYHYFIKCDISGKGVSAALIMVEVATMVINYFNEWKKAMPMSIDLTDLTYKINDFIEERGYEGKRFAAFTLGVWDSDTGTAYLCEAGDRKLHVWDARRRTLLEELLPDSPAAGPFPSFMFQNQRPFEQVKRSLNKDDILFLYTDGIEEAKRHFRDPSFVRTECDHLVDPYAFLAGFLQERLGLTQTAADGPSGFTAGSASDLMAGLAAELAADTAKASAEAVINSAIEEATAKAVKALFASMPKHAARMGHRQRLSTDEAIKAFVHHCGHHGEKALKRAFEDVMAEVDRHLAEHFISKPPAEFLGAQLEATALASAESIVVKLVETAAVTIEKANPGRERSEIKEALREPIGAVARPQTEATVRRLAARMAARLKETPDGKFTSRPKRAHIKRFIEDAPEVAGERLAAALRVDPATPGAAKVAALARGEGLASFAKVLLEAEVEHENHKVGDDNEEFGYDRITAVLEAVDGRGSYHLHKRHNPVKDDLLTFNFSTCEGTLEEKVMALIAVEKVYRMYPDPQATEADIVLVDQKVDAFLEKHFDQYRLYCSDRRPNFDPGKENPGYMVYAGIKEDDQYDDLTILAIKRK